MASTLLWLRPALRSSLLCLMALSLGACTAPGGPGSGDDDDAPADDDDDAPVGVPLLGAGQHTEDSTSVELVADSGDGISQPRDLAFHPSNRGDLWIAGKGHSLVVLHDTGTADQSATVRDQISSGTTHFYAVPSGIAFSYDNDNWASSHETDEPTQGNATPFDFMGPTLWTGDLELYNTAPAHGQHLDMLHNSPNGMGIAWEEGNTFWYFDGYHSAITRYAFNSDHGLGGADHSDGVTSRYVEGEVAWFESIPSGLAFDAETDELFIADTGNKRIAVLDCASGEVGVQLPQNYDSTDQHRVDGASIADFSLGEDNSFSRPSGIALHGDHVFISDARHSRILALDRVTGDLVDWLELDVPEWSLMGMEFDDEGNLYVANYTEDQILRISAPE